MLPTVSSSVAYDQRMAHITRRLNEFFALFVMPAHFRERDDIALTFVRSAADTINRMISTASSEDEIRNHVSDILDEVQRTTRSREWPQVAQFHSAAEKIGKKKQNHSRIDGPSAEFKADPEVIAAKRIMAGEPVSEQWVFEPRAAALIERHGVTQGQIDSYRKYVQHQCIAIYGKPRYDDHNNLVDEGGGRRRFRDLVDGYRR